MRVLIVGGGSIGRRHYEGLGKSTGIHSVDIVEPDKKAINEIKKIEPRPVSICNLHRSIPEGQVFDVTIIATNSNERRWVYDKVKDISGAIIMEKFLFNNEEEYNLEKNVPVFVNMPRRAMFDYRKLRGELNGSVDLLISRNNLPGLFSNAIHYADLLYFFTGGIELDITIDLRDEYFSKRSGYGDAHGIIVMKNNKGACVVRSAPGKPISPLVIDGCVIFEDKNKIIKKGEISNFNYLLQSEMTGNIVNDLCNTGSCQLPDYESASYLHRLILKEMRRLGCDFRIT